MSTELINKAVVTQFITELFETLSSEHMPALVTNDFRAHAWTSYDTPAFEGVRHVEQILTILRATFRNPRVRVEELAAFEPVIAPPEKASQGFRASGIPCRVYACPRGGAPCQGAVL